MFDSITLFLLFPHLPKEILLPFIQSSPLLAGLIAATDNDSLHWKTLSVSEFTQLIARIDDFSHLEFSTLIAFFTQNSMQFMAEFNEFLIQNNELAKNVLPKLLKLIYFDYSFRAFYRDSWSVITTRMMDKIPLSIFDEDEKNPLKKEFINTVTTKQMITHALSSDLVKNTDYSFYKPLGRTLLFKHNDSDRVLAIKLTKGGKDDQELEKEFVTTRFLGENKKEIGLISDMPAVKGLYYVDDILKLANNLKNNTNSDFKNFDQMTKNNRSNLCYVYEAGPEYFTYLYDTPADLSLKSANIALHDLMLLQEKLGLYYNQLIKMFHGEKRRYRVLTNTLYHRSHLDMMCGEIGMGRMDAYHKAVDYPNIRMFPFCLADLGDFLIKIANDYYLISSKQLEKTDVFNSLEGIQRIDEPWGDRATSITTINAFAEYLYSLTLILARATKTQDDWTKLAEGMIHITAAQISRATNKDIQDIEAYLNAGVNVKLLAAQMKFFMTSEHVAYIEKNIIPNEIFGMAVEVDKGVTTYPQYSHWHAGLGSANKIEEGLDLGVFSGNNPLTELSKLLNFFIYTLGCGKYTLQNKMQLDKYQEQNLSPLRLNGIFNETIKKVTNPDTDRISSNRPTF